MRLELYLFVQALRHIFHSFRSELQLESRLQSDGKRTRRFGDSDIPLAASACKGGPPSRPCWSLRGDNAAKAQLTISFACGNVWCGPRHVSLTWNGQKPLRVDN
jgi:hypothetical protein